MSDDEDRPGAPEFESRRADARKVIDAIDGAFAHEGPQRHNWFEEVYSRADGDAAGVPWADMKAKPQLIDWLAKNPGGGRTAIDIACGLGDNAEALGQAGYQTTAFDYAAGAVEWASERFAGGNVDYQVADLFNLPAAWHGAFDLVHECYTIQAMRGELRDKAFAAIAGLVSPGGRLLMITRTRPDESEPKGPPWPLSPLEIKKFEALGLRRESLTAYETRRGDRAIPHVMAEFLRAD